MKSINIEIQTMCPNCGSTDNITFSDNHKYAKCTFCGTKYLGGEDELKEKMLECSEVKKQLKDAAIKEAQEYVREELSKALKNAITGLKNVKFTHK